MSSARNLYLSMFSRVCTKTLFSRKGPQIRWLASTSSSLCSSQQKLLVLLCQLGHFQLLDSSWYFLLFMCYGCHSLSYISNFLFLSFSSAQLSNRLPSLVHVVQKPPAHQFKQPCAAAVLIACAVAVSNTWAATVSCTRASAKCISWTARGPSYCAAASSSRCVGIFKAVDLYIYIAGTVSWLSRLVSSD